MREQYEALQQLLQYDVRCHEQMADLQELFQNATPEDFASIRKRFTQFSADVERMIASLDHMNPGAYSSLWDYHRKFDFYTRFLLAPPKLDTAPPYVLSLNEITPTDRRVGNKSRHLAILRNELDIHTPEGFAIQASAFHHFIEHNQLRQKIDSYLAELAIESHDSLHSTSQKLMELIRSAPIPPELENEIRSGCETLFQEDNATTYSVRSSGIGEDGDSSFAGQFTTVLDVDRESILNAYKEVLASKYSPEALYYRIHQGWGDEETAMTVLVMPMVAARLSGVLYTDAIVYDHLDNKVMHLHVVEGPGDALVSGKAVPESYLIDRSRPHTIRTVPPASLESSTLFRLAAEGMRIEQYFNAPQDIEWTLDKNDILYILQARSLHRSRPQSESDGVQPDEKYTKRIIITDCEKSSAGRAAGEIFLLTEDLSLEHIPKGCILVTKNTPPSYVKFMQKVAAVLSESGSKASHFATVAREFSIPYLSGINNCLQLFHTGDEVTIDGYSGTVYSGILEELLNNEPRPRSGTNYSRIVSEAAKFITTLDLTRPEDDNFTPEGCRSMHDIIRFCHEKALHILFSAGKPGSARGARRLQATIPLDVYLFDIGGGIIDSAIAPVPLDQIDSPPFHAVWRGLSHPGVQWKQKPFDWNAYERIELSGAVPPKKDDFAFASYAVIGHDYLHFHMRFGYHFTILDTLCGPESVTNHCMIRFAGGGGDYDHRSLRILFLYAVLERLGFEVENRGDLLEAKLFGVASDDLLAKLDLLGRLLGATKLMDMVLADEEMVSQCVEEFFLEKYSFSEQG